MVDWVVHRPEIAERAKQRCDAAFCERFVDVPRYLSTWTRDIGYLEGKRVLDFGCGRGEAACGTAIFHNAEFVLGVDYADRTRDLAERIGRCTDGVGMPRNVGFKQLSLTDGLNEGEFDFIYSWSFLLRLSPSLLPQIVSQLYDRLVLGGRILIQLSPLYYSPNGAQLATHGVGPWEHLLLPLAELRARVFDAQRFPETSSSAAWAWYENLGRIGAEEASRLFCENGFYQIRNYETVVSMRPPEALRDCCREDALCREQAVFLFAKA